MSTPLVEVRGLTKHFTRGGGLFQKGTRGEGRGRRQLLDRRGRDVRPGRRIGQRQEHHRTLHAAPDRAHGRRGALTRRETCWPTRRRAHAGGAPPHADDLPGSVLVAQSADAGARHRRRAAHHPQARLARASGGARVAELFRLVGPRPGAPRSLSARVQRAASGSASAWRARWRSKPDVHHRRRAGVGARRLDSGAGREPADGPAAAPAADLSLHRARSAAGAAHLPARRGDVSRPHRRDGRRPSRSSPTRRIRTRGRCCRRFR